MIILLTAHVIISVIAIKLYRDDCLITRYQPTILAILIAIFPLINLILIHFSMKNISKVLPFKPTLAEYVLGIRDEDYWAD